MKLFHGPSEPDASLGELGKQICFGSEGVARDKLVFEMLKHGHDMIEVSSFYHRQWAPEYPEFVNFKYDGTTYQIRLRQHRAKVYFAEGLNKFRKDLSIFESMIIKFLACNNKSMFDLYFIPSLECKTCGRPQLMSRQHIWTLEITQSMLGAPGPLRLPYCAITHANAYSQQMTILRRFGPPLQWNVVVVDNGVARRYVVQPWAHLTGWHQYSFRPHSVFPREISLWLLKPSLLENGMQINKLSELGIEIHSVLTRRSQWSSQPSSSPQLSSKETFILKSEAKTISEINNLCEQSISITADHDPLIGLPLTPTKRQPFHECDDEARSSQIAPAQLLSNKLAKLDQIE
ncbi:hypothetical protein JHK87_012334 [Glycine soja]|nr:hypothetical protein JHK87_012334 [Glycine soja]